MIVVDASVLIEIVAGASPDPRLAIRVATEELHAPHLVDVEVLHVLRSLALRNVATVPQLQGAKSAFRSLQMTRYSHVPLADRIWELRSNLSAHDATYVALAESLGIPLVTTDARIKNAPGLRTDIDVYRPSRRP